MIDLKDRVSFINKIHLFNGMKEIDLARIATELHEQRVNVDDVIFKRNDEPDGFYMIYRGNVKVTRPAELGRDEYLAKLVAGDYFGEEALFEKRKRSATVTALENSTLLFLSRKRFEQLLEQYPNLKPNFHVAIQSRRLARQTRFKWLGPNEVIYFLARRHTIRLYQALVAPAISLLLPAFLFFWAFLAKAATPLAVGAVALIGILLWAGWNALDWSNDYYIVTNQRVIWLEKVIGMYDSRQEAPLSTILSVGLETDMLGRALDYGNVIVRTFVGQIEFDYVNHPTQAADMIREYWERSKVKGTVTQKDLMKNAIRLKLGMTVESKPVEELPPIVVESPSLQKRSMAWIVLSNMFKLRVVDGATVTYRKHWFVLFMQVWKPLALFLMVIGLIVSRAILLARSPELSLVFQNAQGQTALDTLMVALPLFLLPIAGWLAYEYVDWKNDIFMVTNNEIVDIDKKPFGTQERRAAQLDNILSTEYKRIGLAGYIFNFGTVFISVGGTKLEFQDVLDPAGVQADIDRRRSARIAKKNEDAAVSDRERMATWIAAYHQSRDSFGADVAPPPKDEDEEIRLIRSDEDEISE